jgi:hypothetical protein
VDNENRVEKDVHRIKITLFVKGKTCRILNDGAADRGVLKLFLIHLDKRYSKSLYFIRLSFIRYILREV